jgi:RHS repeat-associated protein
MGTRYDALGRVEERIWPAAEDEADDARERSVYGPLTVADYDLEDTLAGGPHEGTPTVAHRNGLGKTVAIDHFLTAGGEPITYTMLYDELGEPAGTIDPLGARHEEVRNLVGWVTTVHDPDSGLSTREYDEVGNVVLTTDARGVAVRTAFDGVNRPVAQWDEADEAGTRVERTYDRPGDCPPSTCSNVAAKPVRVSYPLGDGRMGADVHGYTARGLEAQTERSLDGRVFRFATAHDHADRVVGNTYPDGRTIAIELDGTGEVAAVPGYVNQVTWDSRWLPSEFHLANGVVVRMARDGRKRLTSLSATGPSDAALLDLAYTRDRAGHVQDVVDGRADDQQPSASAHYAYDSLYRLTSAELDPARPAWHETLTIAHDDGARIVSLTSDQGATSAAHVGDYQYGQGAGTHAVSHAGPVSFGYDPAGNVTTRGDVAYAWDHLGRMVRATRGAETLSTWTYGANPEHLMERSGGHVTYYLAGDFEVHDGVAVTYVMAPEERVVRIEDASFGPHVLPDVAPATGDDATLAPAPDGVITAGDAWLAVGVANGELAFAGDATAGDATEVLRASAMRALLGDAPRVRYALHDHLGNTVAETDAEGAVVSRTGYYPFGALRQGGEGTDRHLFAGKVNNAATGLVEFGARSYDPWTGRWISPDPAFRVQEDVDPTDVPEATTAYGYVGGDPVNAHDPDGLSKVPDCSRFWGRVVATVKLRWGSSLRLSMAQMVRNRLLPGERPSLKVAWQSAKFAGRVGGWNQRNAFFDGGDKGIHATIRSKDALKREYGQAQMELGSTSKRQDGKGFNVDLAVVGGLMMGKLGHKEAFAFAQQFDRSEFVKSGKVPFGKISDIAYNSEAFNITTSSRLELRNVEINERVFDRKLHPGRMKLKK